MQLIPHLVGSGEAFFSVFPFRECSEFDTRVRKLSHIWRSPGF